LSRCSHVFQRFDVWLWMTSVCVFNQLMKGRCLQFAWGNGVYYENTLAWRVMNTVLYSSACCIGCVCWMNCCLMWLINVCCLCGSAAIPYAKQPQLNMPRQRVSFPIFSPKLARNQLATEARGRVAATVLQIATHNPHGLLQRLIS